MTINTSNPDRNHPPEVWSCLQELHRFHPPAVPSLPTPFELPDGSFDAQAYINWLNR